MSNEWIEAAEAELEAGACEPHTEYERDCVRRGIGAALLGIAEELRQLNETLRG